MRGRYRTDARRTGRPHVTIVPERERVLFIGTQFSILYTFMHSPGGKFTGKRGGGLFIERTITTGLYKTKHAEAG